VQYGSETLDTGAAGDTIGPDSAIATLETVHRVRTPEGRAASSLNAYKGGLRSLLRKMSVLLREQRDKLKEVA